MLGCMASNSTPSLMGPITSHVLPISLLISKKTRQSCSLVFEGYSMLVGLTRVPSSNWTNLFLIGPSRWPTFGSSPIFCGVDHVLPPSSDVVTIPHQVCGLGPTYQKSMCVPPL